MFPRTAFNSRVAELTFEQLIKNPNATVFLLSTFSSTQLPE